MIALLAVAGSLLGALLGWIVFVPILSMALPLVAATVFLRRSGLTWRDLGFMKPMPLRRCLALGVGAAALVMLLMSVVIGPLLQALGAPPPDVSLIADAIVGNPLNYLLFLIPIAWGSAAFGEELLLRGFVLNRLGELTGLRLALPLQALLFALGHVYQGTTGMLSIFVVGLVLGYVYLRAGRNLWPPILAHGLIDTVGLTLLYLGFQDSAPPS
ncbi:MAG TPA: type II CAAX endopeptidase family protein [Pseudomonadales bacterium]